MAGKQRTAGRRRWVVLGIALLILLCLLTTCVVVAQRSRYDPDRAEPADTPRRASMPATGTTSPTVPTPSLRPAKPWHKAHWRAATKANQIIGLKYPPKPPGDAARADPLRVAIALLATLDGTDPGSWKPGANPARGYMTERLDRIYTPDKSGPPPADVHAKIPDGGTAAYRFYCYVPRGYTDDKVAVVCGYRVRVERASGARYRLDTAPQQRLTVKHRDDGWRVARIGSATPVGD